MPALDQQAQGPVIAREVSGREGVIELNGPGELLLGLD
jgi:hypothetical protein